MEMRSSPKKNLCEIIKDKGGDYFFVVKNNQPVRRQEIEAYFKARLVPYVEDVDKGHGRVEVRKLWVLPVLWPDYHWKGCKELCKIERTRWKNGVQSIEIDYAITSLSLEEASPQVLLALWRDHWKIENQLHRQKDVQFQEDACIARTGNTPHFLAALRNTVLTLLSNCKGRLKFLREQFARFPKRSLKLLTEN